MNGFFAVLAIVVFLALILVTAMRPTVSQFSLSELKRRAKTSQQYRRELKRFQYYAEIMTLFRSAQAMLLIIGAFLFVGGFGWVLGVLLACMVALLYPGLARVRLLQPVSKKLYLHSEPYVFTIVVRMQKLLRFIRHPHMVNPHETVTIHSIEELTEIVTNSSDVLGPNERKLLASAIAFPGKQVGDYMTPRSSIDFVKKNEFLGPLVLDELHKLGHSRLPVISNDLDHVVGILQTHSLLSLDVKKSISAEKMMEETVYYIHEDDTLEHALAAFLRTRHHLFIVINSLRETVGLITLEDVIETIIGRRIVDEDDIHADIRAVAMHKGQSNNNPAGHIDI